MLTKSWKFQFPSTPLIILTATAPSVEHSIHQLVRSPVTSKISINQPNIIFLQCTEIPSDEDAVTCFATRVSQIIQNE